MADQLKHQIRWVHAARNSEKGITAVPSLGFLVSFAREYLGPNSHCAPILHAQSESRLDDCSGQ